MAQILEKCKIFREGPQSGSKLPVIEKDYTSCISDSFFMPPEYPRWTAGISPLDCPCFIVNKGKDINFLSF